MSTTGLAVVNFVSSLRLSRDAQLAGTESFTHRTQALSCIQHARSAAWTVAHFWVGMPRSERAIPLSGFPPLAREPMFRGIRWRDLNADSIEAAFEGLSRIAVVADRDAGRAIKVLSHCPHALVMGVEGACDQSILAAGLVLPWTTIVDSSPLIALGERSS